MAKSKIDSGSKDGASIFEPHDHAECSDDAMAAVEAVCAERQARLTPVRRRVLEILWESHRPISAYELLDRLRVENLGSQPPSVYRALDFLIEHGFAHKLVRLNAFLACAHPREAHSPIFLICRACQRVAEMREPRLREALINATQGASFEVEDAVIEIEGRCHACSKEASEQA